MSGAAHPFEAAGLGKAPFRFVGVERRVGPINYPMPNGVTMSVGAPGQPMGCCEFCSQGIADCYMIRSADGRTFMVGCVCVGKTDDVALMKVVEQAARKFALEQKHTRDKARILATIDLLARSDVQAALESKPGPRFGTLLEWADWMMRNAGTAGRLKVCRVVEQTQAEGRAS